MAEQLNEPIAPAGRPRLAALRWLRERLLPALNAANHASAVALARLPERIRGYGHVKLANVATARAQQKDLLARFDAGEAPSATQAPTERKVISIAAL